MAASTSTYQFQNTATGILGDKRDTMLINQLHLRSELGRPMRRGYSIPQDFVFGQPQAEREFGVAELLSGYTPTVSLPFHHKKKEKTVRDFAKLNKAALEAGLTNAIDQSQFRATHDIRKTTEDRLPGTRRTRRLPPTMVFGVSTRPSTPIFELLEHKYQDKWLSEQRQQDLEARAQQVQKKKNQKIYETRASLLRVYQNPVEDRPLWQMPKFSRRAKPHLESFRSENAKSAAFQSHEFDRVGRQGLHGHGIYEPAKN